MENAPQPNGDSFFDSQMPRIVVKFLDTIQVPYVDNAERKISSDYFNGFWKSLKKDFPGITLNRKFTSLDAKQIDELTLKAQRADESYKASNLLSYFVIECKYDTDKELLINRLQDSTFVSIAYLDGTPTPPPFVNAADDPRSVNQGYLDAAPGGINARYAWTFPGGDGAGAAFVDLEQGWTLGHDDLMAAGITLISGVNNAWFGHGTSVLGEIRAVDNNTGCVGISPNSTGRVVSQFRTATNYNTADAILSAIAVMNFGDVLLLEAQTTIAGATGYMPVEVEAATFDVLRIAYALGIIVVEAGANGSSNLDTYSHPVLGQILNRSSANFRDSGAIMVGAASSAAPHTRLGFSSFGSRIDCYGWGENINTTGNGGTGNLTNSYTSSFGGTSGASPIITGAVLLVQSLMQERFGFKLGPKEMRALLSNPITGTSSSNPAVDKIGVLPNLRSIIDTVLSIGPDVLVRDYVGDTGDSHTGAASASPDIIVVPTVVADPQASFGQGSGTENRDDLGFKVEMGQDNYVYVRVQNRGGAEAIELQARVYWSEVATLVTPNLWHLVGNISIPTVPAGHVLTVSNAITWAKADIPAEGHYCFVGIIGNDQDPAPEIADFMNWDNFIRFIKNNNNVTWRNFNVVDEVLDLDAMMPGFMGLPFLLTTASDKARTYGLQIQSKLPQGAKVFFELPLYFARKFHKITSDTLIDNRKKTAFIPIRPIGTHPLEKLELPAKLAEKCSLRVFIPKEYRKHDFDIAIQQFYEELEVGRITWRLTTKKRTLPGT